MSELFAVCATYEVDDGDAQGFVLARLDENGQPQPWPIFITRRGDAYFGYENACPHEGTRLDTVPGEFMDRDGKLVSCSRHQARFDLETGLCIAGPCKGQTLKSFPLVVDDGDVCLVDIALAEEDGLDIEDPNSVPEVMITGD